MRRAHEWRPPGLAAVATLGLALWASTPVMAQQPAVGCEVADFNIVLKLFLPLGADGSGAPAGDGMLGSLEIFHQKVPKDFRYWSLDGKRPAQFWNDGEELRLLLLLGAGENRVRLVIEATRRGDASEHRGSFRLETGSVRVTGRLACSVG